MLEVDLSDNAFEFLAQLIRTMKGFKECWPKIMPAFDHFIDRCYSLFAQSVESDCDSDIALIMKLVARIFESFSERLMNNEKALFLLLLKLNKKTESINSLVIGIKKFVKKICVSSDHGPFICFLNLLWKKIPSIMQFSNHELAKNEKELVREADSLGGKLSTTEDDSLEEQIFLRKNLGSLSSRFGYFLLEMDLLATLSKEIANIKSDTELESFSFFFGFVIQRLVVSPKIPEETIRLKCLDKIQALVFNPNVLSQIYEIFQGLIYRWPDVRIFQTSRNILYLITDLSPLVCPLLLKHNNQLFNQMQHMLNELLKTKDSKNNKFNKAVFSATIAIIENLPLDKISEHHQWISEILAYSDYDQQILKQLVSVLAKSKDHGAIRGLFNLLQTEITKIIQLPNIAHNLATIDKLHEYLKKLKSVVKSSPKHFIFEFKADIFGVCSNVVDAIPSNNKISEKNCEVVYAVLHKIADICNPDEILSFLSPFLAKINIYFGQFFLPCYLYYFEIVIDLFYQHQYFEYFYGILQSVLTSFFKLIELGSFDGDQHSISSAFSFLYDNNGLLIEDVIDDLLGLVKKFIDREPLLIFKSAFFPSLISLLDKIFNRYFIYNVSTMIPILSSIVNNLDQHSEIKSQTTMREFWVIINRRCINFLVHESLMDKTIRYLFKLIFKTLHAYPELIMAVLEIEILQINHLILTDKEKQHFILMVRTKLVNGFDLRKYREIHEISQFMKKFTKRIKDYQSSEL
jgi:hypothetical protein